MIWQRTFWRATLERVISTTAQAGAALLGGDGLGILDIDWTQAASVAGLAGILSLLKCIAAAGIHPATGPSLTGAETPRDA